MERLQKLHKYFIWVRLNEKNTKAFKHMRLNKQTDFAFMQMAVLSAYMRALLQFTDCIQTRCILVINGASEYRFHSIPNKF